MRLMTVPCLLLLTATSLFAGGPADPSENLRKMFDTAARAEGAMAAQGLVNIVNQAAAAALGYGQDHTDYNKNYMRRCFQVLMNDCQDEIAKLTAPEAANAMASMLAGASPAAQEAILFGQKGAPAHEKLDAEATKLLKADANYRLHVAAMEMLGAHKYTAAVEKVLQYLKAKEFPSAQLAACRALAMMPDKKSIKPLIDYMGEVKLGGGGRYLYEAANALRCITGQKLPADKSTWADWWTKAEATFEVNKNPATFNYELTEGGEQSYYEIPVVENRMLFVFDNSGSMQYGGNPNRLESAKKELKEFILKLLPKQKFNIITFTTGMRDSKAVLDRMQKANTLVDASEPNKKIAAAFVDGIKHLGGTPTSSAMEEALLDVCMAYGCETIYLVTDGGPNGWTNPREMHVEKDMRHITWLNQPLKVRINTIGIYSWAAGDENKIPGAPKENHEDMKKFLKDLAKSNDGAYKEIGGDKEKK